MNLPTDMFCDACFAPALSLANIGLYTSIFLQILLNTIIVLSKFSYIQLDISNIPEKKSSVIMLKGSKSIMTDINNKNAKQIVILRPATPGNHCSRLDIQPIVHLR